MGFPRANGRAVALMVKDRSQTLTPRYKGMSIADAPRSIPDTGRWLIDGYTTAVKCRKLAYKGSIAASCFDNYTLDAKRHLNRWPPKGKGFYWRLVVWTGPDQHLGALAVGCPSRRLKEKPHATPKNVETLAAHLQSIKPIQLKLGEMATKGPRRAETHVSPRG